MSFNPDLLIYRASGATSPRQGGLSTTTMLPFLAGPMNFVLRASSRLYLLIAVVSLLIATGCSSDIPTITPTQAPKVPRDEMVQYLKSFNEVQNSLFKQASEIEGPDNETLRNDSEVLYNLVSSYFDLATDSVTSVSNLIPPPGDHLAIRHWQSAVGYYTDGRSLYQGLMLAIKADDAKRIETVLTKLQNDSIRGLMINKATEDLMATYRILDFEVDYRQREQQ